MVGFPRHWLLSHPPDLGTKKPYNCKQRPCGISLLPVAPDDILAQVQGFIRTHLHNSYSPIRHPVFLQPTNPDKGRTILQWLTKKKKKESILKDKLDFKFSSHPVALLGIFLCVCRMCALPHPSKLSSAVLQVLTVSLLSPVALKAFSAFEFFNWQRKWAQWRSLDGNSSLCGRRHSEPVPGELMHWCSARTPFCPWMRL